VAGRTDGGRQIDSVAFLDPADSQETTFWSYVIAALQRVAPGVGANSLPRAAVHR
jgi:hypothetical protein